MDDADDDLSILLSNMARKDLGAKTNAQSWFFQ